MPVSVWASAGRGCACRHGGDLVRDRPGSATPGELMSLQHEEGMPMEQRGVGGALRALFHGCLLATVACGQAAAQVLSLPASMVVPGFPIDIPRYSGTYASGPAAGISVADIDGDGRSEILLTSIPLGPVLVFRNDGTPAAGWPAAGESAGFGYFAVADAVPGSPGSEVFMAHFANPGPSLQLFSSVGQLLPGWPVASANFAALSPAIHDLDNDGIPELFVEEEDWKLHAYTPSGQALPGWPVGSLADGCMNGQAVYIPTFIDLDRDGRLDVVVANGGGVGGSTPATCIEAYDKLGRAIPGFARYLPGIGLGSNVLTVGDVDGDGIEDLVTIQGNPGGDVYSVAAVHILGPDGAPKRTVALESRRVTEGVQVLADLDGDGVPDIVALSPSTISAFKGNGDPLPGWPVRYYAFQDPAAVDLTDLFECGLAIGDVDGDLEPDVVFCASGAEQSEHTYLFVLDRYGVPKAGSPYLLDAMGANGRGPVIADIDGDGHNEIVVGTDRQLWALSLDRSRPHGRVEWQQFASEASNSGRYAPRFSAAASPVDLSITGSAPPLSASTTASAQVTVANQGTGPANASVTVTLPPEAKGRAAIPAGCTAFENEITCLLANLGGNSQRSVSIPVCIDTAGTYQLFARVRGSGPEANYSDNRVSVRITVSAGGGAGCVVRAVPTRTSYVKMSGPTTVYTSSPLQFYWRSFNVTGCQLVSPEVGTIPETSLGYYDHDSGATTGLKHYQMNCTGQSGVVSSAVDVQVIEATLSFSSSSPQVVPGGQVTLTWSSQGMDSCTASGAWSGPRATSGTEQVTIAAGANMFEIICTGALGVGDRRISVEGAKPPPPPVTPPAPAGGGGGGGAFDLHALAVLAALAAFRCIARCRRAPAPPGNRRATEKAPAPVKGAWLGTAA